MTRRAKKKEAGRRVIVIGAGNIGSHLIPHLGRMPEIAAVVMEPVLCNSGCILPRPGYLQAVAELCRRHGALFVFDEVITGFRLALGGAQSYYGVTPDLATFGKAIDNGADRCDEIGFVQICGGRLRPCDGAVRNLGGELLLQARLCAVVSRNVERSVADGGVQVGRY